MGLIIMSLGIIWPVLQCYITKCALLTIFIPFRVLHCSVLLSDSRLHLFLQTQLSTEEIDACASGKTEYSVFEAIHKFANSNRRFPAEEEEKTSHYLDPESSSSKLGHKCDGHFLQGCNLDKDHKEIWTTILPPK
ncbi:hypothetical protein XENTR_v10016152 [Xenopus tropicalis]|nr:hypothetical protein XENTR_v10016152 [Xenopus tropicalis]